MAFDKGKYDKEYAKAHITRKFIPFNDTVPEDAKMLEWLAQCGNVTQYIKNLIRENMEAHTEIVYCDDSLSKRLSNVKPEPRDD